MGTLEVLNKVGKGWKVGNFMESYFCLMSVSMKQRPVVDRLVLLLSTAKAVASAISDNAIEENEALDQEALLMFSRDLNSIKHHLHTAYDVPVEEA